MNIGFRRRRRTMIGTSPWFSALGIIVINPSFAFALQVLVYKQTNAVQPLSASTHTASDFLVSKSFPWLLGNLKWHVALLSMILKIFIAFDTSLDQVMPPILHLRKLSLSHHTPIFDVKITVLEMLQPLSAHYFIKNGLTSGTWKYFWALASNFFILSRKLKSLANN